MIERLLYHQIKEKLFAGKVIVITGPRQSGKTTLLKELASNYADVLFLNADNIEIQTLFDVQSVNRLKTIFGNHKIVIIDEAQRIKNIGIKVKIAADELKEIQLILTGSSSFELSEEINEPLTGRKFEYTLFPVSFAEMVNHHQFINENVLINHRLVFGYYPEIVINQGDEKELLNLLTNSYLYKDILSWNKIRKSDKIVKLLQALAFQIGNQVSFHELGQIVGLNSETVESYIQLLEKSFVIFRLGSFSRNARNELKKSQKIYFYDNGVRNTLIANYNPVELRNDVGSLWENFLISERKKYLSYNNIYANSFFWRNHAQQEIDYIEEREGKLFAYEIKWDKSKVKFPKSFLEAYNECETNVITFQDYESFIF